MPVDVDVDLTCDKCGRTCWEEDVLCDKCRTHVIAQDYITPTLDSACVDLSKNYARWLETGAKIDLRTLIANVAFELFKMGAIKRDAFESIAPAGFLR